MARECSLEVVTSVCDVHRKIGVGQELLINCYVFMVSTKVIKYFTRLKCLVEMFRSELNNTVHLYYKVTGLRKVIAYARDC